MEEEYKELLKQQDKLYNKLSSVLTKRKHFKWLNDLIDVEIELEKFCNM